MKLKSKIYLPLFSLLAIFFASIIIIFSPISKKTATNPSWQTYTSSLDNYQVSFPSSWQIIDNLPEELTLEKPNYARISIDSSNQRGFTLPIKAWINKTNTKLENDPNRFPASTTIQIIDNDDVLKNIPDLVTVNASFFGQDGKQYIFPHQKKIFSITGIYFVDDSMNEEQIASISAEINQILSTFKFTEPQSLKTYKNDEFEFQYPSNIKIGFDPEGLSLCYKTDPCMSISVTKPVTDNNSKIEVVDFAGKKVSKYSFFANETGIDGFVMILPTNEPIYLTSFESDFYNQILSTFKFTQK